MMNDCANFPCPYPLDFLIIKLLKIVLSSSIKVFPN